MPPSREVIDKNLANQEWLKSFMTEYCPNVNNPKTKKALRGEWSHAVTLFGSNNSPTDDDEELAVKLVDGETTWPSEGVVKQKNIVLLTAGKFQEMNCYANSFVYSPSMSPEYKITFDDLPQADFDVNKKKIIEQLFQIAVEHEASWKTWLKGLLSKVLPS